MDFPRIDDLVEKWASTYTPIKHDPKKGSKQKRFYRFNSLEETQELLMKLNVQTTPVAGIVTQNDGVSVGKFLRMTVAVYVFTKQKAQVSDTAANEKAAADAKIYGVEILNDLWTWLKYKKDHASKSPKSDEYWMQGMDLDKIQICNEDRQHNGWWPTFLMLKVDIPRQTCVDWSKYSEE